MASDLKSQIKAAIDECRAHAKLNYFRAVKDIAEIMGVDVWVLSKWVENSRLPVEEIPAFEAACGCNALSKCLAAAGGYMTIPAPTGRYAKVASSAEVHLHVAAAIAESVAAEIDPSSSDEAVMAISKAIESLAWLRNQLSITGGKT